MASSKRDLKRKCKKELVTSTILEGIFLFYFGLPLIPLFCYNRENKMTGGKCHEYTYPFGGQTC